MRIIGGKHRGRILSEFSGSEVRPTADRVKESLFNILFTKIQGASVLDLFAGSGSLGIECISRGAEFVVFNDVRKESVDLLQKNLRKIHESAKVYNLDYADFLSRCQEKFDLIFLDPPYQEEYGIQALETIARRRLLNGNGIVVYERDRHFSGDVKPLEIIDERKYGRTFLTFFTLEK